LLPITGLPGGYPRPLVAIRRWACSRYREGLPKNAWSCEINLALARKTDRFVIIAVADANIDELLRVTANILSAARLPVNYD
jgi:hypothetical protein